MSSKTTSIAWFFGAFLTLLIAIHAPYLKLPYFWDELGQFVPASLDILQLGRWIPKTTLPNVHPPAVMAYAALVWRIFGYSIPAARIAMLVIAALGVLFSFLLAIRLSRKTFGAPAFAAVLFLLASPIFYTQAMMVQLDMPAMTLTALALLLFLDDRFATCAIACTALVLVKETAISTPFALAAWLWIHEKKRRESLYFLAPAIALGAWLIALHHATGMWLGNAEFARFNVSESLRIAHIAVTLQRRLYFLFVSDGLWIGAITMFAGSRFLRGREWNIAFTVAGAQILLVTIFGGASLDRYNLPALPVIYAAMAAAGSALPSSWRWVTRAAIIGGLSLGLFWNPPYPFSLEDNLAMTDFIALQQDAAAYLEAHDADQRIASAWPFTDALRRPEFGYVKRRLAVEPVEDFRLTSLANLDRNKADVLVVFSRVWGLDGGALDFDFVRNLLERFWGYYRQATPEQIRAGLGFAPVLRWTRHGQWIEVYLPER
ncbi:MAG TPA: glycosyltransferase family 39 protein [Bryobacteraceae bacterium]|nr:glycosyltransferase family 39 protein [Bryobacteraceae bacterium]